MFIPSVAHFSGILENKWVRSGSSADIGVPVCLLGVWGRRCGCVGVFPARALAFLPPSPALPACLPACHPINIALHNPGSVSARLDPLPQVDRLLLYASDPRVDNIESFHLPVSLVHGSFTKTSPADRS